MIPTQQDFADYYSIDKALRECNKKGKPTWTTQDQWESYLKWLRSMHAEIRKVLFPSNKDKLLDAIKGIV